MRVMFLESTTLSRDQSCNNVKKRFTKRLVSWECLFWVLMNFPSVLQCVAVCCNVLQCVAVCGIFSCHVAEEALSRRVFLWLFFWHYYLSRKTYKRELQYPSSETWFEALTNKATHCNTLQHTATHCNTLQHTATHCNTLIDTAIPILWYFDWAPVSCREKRQCTVLLIRVLQCITMCCSVLQCVAVCCRVVQRVAMCCSVAACSHVCWWVTAC